MFSIIHSVLSHLFDVFLLFHFLHVSHVLDVLHTYSMFSRPGWQDSAICGALSLLTLCKAPTNVCKCELMMSELWLRTLSLCKTFCQVNGRRWVEPRCSGRGQKSPNWVLTQIFFCADRNLSRSKSKVE